MGVTVAAGVGLYIISDQLNKHVYTGDEKGEGMYSVERPDNWHGFPACGTQFSHYEIGGIVSEEVTRWKCFIGRPERYIDWGADGKIDAVGLLSSGNNITLNRKEHYASHKDLFDRGQEYFDATKARFKDEINTIRN